MRWLACYAIALPWLLTIVARLSRPRNDNEAAGLAYSRLHGGWERLRLTALCLTYGAACALLLAAIASQGAS